MEQSSIRCLYEKEAGQGCSCDLRSPCQIVTFHIAMDHGLVLIAVLWIVYSYGVFLMSVDHGVGND
jgi:hypothetical protein